MEEIPLKRGQFFTQALVGDQIQTVDVLDLDNDSRFIFICRILHNHGLLIGRSPQGEELMLRANLPPTTNSSEP